MKNQSEIMPEILEGVGARKIAAAKTAANKIGISVEQYLQNVNSGLKWCCGCQNFLSRDCFYDNPKISRSNSDGKRTPCKSCRQVNRRPYTPVLPEERKHRSGSTYAKLRGLKSAATKIGVSVEEYLHNLEIGLNWCGSCKTFLSCDLFFDVSGKSVGKDNRCKNCKRAKDRHRYKPVPLEERIRNLPPTDGNKTQARNSVRKQVRKGRLPHARTVPCTDCGHIGDNYRHEYDHFLGYDAINHLNVQCVCQPCHRKRERQRKAK